MGYELKYRNAQSGNQHFVFPQLVNTIKIPYELIINLPKPRYERNIIERDEFGRIIHSKPPPLSL